nr:hypothetical protein BaRGS_005818 [Batillaria attramentaria]
MDSPGLFDTFKSEDEITEIIVRSVAGMEPGPHAVLYVVPIGVRYTREEVFSYNRLKAYLGQDVTNHMIIVLTHGNRLVAEGISIEQYLEEATKEFKEILDECGNRTVVFEKDAKDKTPQIDALLVQAGAVVEANGGRHYRSELTEKIKKDLEEDAKKKVGDQKGLAIA